jgi:hypothetical protein
LDDKHNRIALSVGALDQISGGVDEVRDVDNGERETIAESRTFQRFASFQRRKRSQEPAQVEFSCPHPPDDGPEGLIRQFGGRAGRHGSFAAYPVKGAALIKPALTSQSAFRSSGLS